MRDQDKQAAARDWMLTVQLEARFARSPARYICRRLVQTGRCETEFGPVYIHGLACLYCLKLVRCLPGAQIHDIRVFALSLHVDDRRPSKTQ